MRNPSIILRSSEVTTRKVAAKQTGYDHVPVAAGITGVKKSADYTRGETVNTASRIESSDEVGQVNMRRGNLCAREQRAGPHFHTARESAGAWGRGDLNGLCFRMRDPPPSPCLLLPCSGALHAQKDLYLSIANTVWKDASQSDTTRFKAMQEVLIQRRYSAPPDSLLALARQLVAFTHYRGLLRGHGMEPYGEFPQQHEPMGQC